MFLLTKKSTERFTDLNANVTPPTLNTWIKFNFFVTKTFLIFVSSVCRCRDERAVNFCFISVYLYLTGPIGKKPRHKFSRNFLFGVPFLMLSFLWACYTGTKFFITRILNPNQKVRITSCVTIFVMSQNILADFILYKSPYEKIFELREIDGSSMVAQIASLKHSGESLWLNV